MGIFELAAQLGKVLKEDKRLIALEAARKAYEEDAEVARLKLQSLGTSIDVLTPEQVEYLTRVE